MSYRKKFTCVIDASSYINLAKTVTKLGTLLELFIKEFDFHYSQEVNKEIARNIIVSKKCIDKSTIPDHIQRHSKTLKTKRKSENEYENRLFNVVNGRDTGEKHNLCLIIDLFFSNNKRDLVYLCDDFKARRGFLSKPISSFPIFNVWSTLDFVLCLYVLKGSKDFPFDIADTALRDLNNCVTTVSPNTSNKKVDEKIKRYYLYYKYLEIIKKTLFA